MTQTIEWKKTQPGSTEAVQFSDGMLVTAEDLTKAMHYPLSVIQVLLKAFFGCGIVCGLDLKNPAEEQAAGTTNGKPGSTGTSAHGTPAKRERNFILTVEKGVALGCDGYPIEICGPLKLDLTPDPCRLDREPKEMFVAARRVTDAEAAARPCGCGPAGGEPAQQCSRMRDHALVQAFDKDNLPDELCRVTAAPANKRPDATTPAPHSGKRPTGAAAICDCLKQCGACACCGEPWVLLGSVVVSEQGLGAIDPSGRRHVKPIACICAAIERDQPPTTTRVDSRAGERPPAEVPAADEPPP
jgi:hypothetical protein